MENLLEKSFEKNPSAREILRSAFPIHDNFDWSMPPIDDPEALEKIEQSPLWGNQFREDDVATILDTLKVAGFDTLAVAVKLRSLYEEAGKPRIQKDLKDNKAGNKWSGLINDLLHIVTTSLSKNRKGDFQRKQLPSGLILTPEERDWPLEERHSLQNNIAAGIIMLGDKELEDLRPQAQKVVAMFKKSEIEEERQEMLAEKLALEKAYFQKKFPEFFNTTDTRKSPEAPPEEFQEMIDELPILREILQEAEEELSALENKPDARVDEIRELRDQINGLREEITNRVYLIT